VTSPKTARLGLRRATVVFVLLVTCLASGLVDATPAQAASYTDLGHDDTLVFMTPWETRAIYNQLKYHGHNCLPFTSSLPKVGGLIRKICNPLKWYSAYTRVQFLQLKWMLYNAILWGGCGAFIIDGAGWRPDRVRAAHDDDTNLANPWTLPGKVSHLNGHAFRCNEYADPLHQSNIYSGGDAISYG
jgi:hypothetical protein